MYNAHFKFREAPFGVTPDPQFYYSNAVYREALATLCYGIEARKGFILVAGEVGTGKTTLLRKAMRSFESNIKVAYVCNTLVGFAELLRLILNDLGLSAASDDKLALIGQLNEYLIEQLTEGNIVALLVDEAQDLSAEILEELRLLGNLETDKDKLLQIVLIGQPELEHKLDQANLRQLKQRVALRCRLHPISANEVGAYIDSRLRTVGHRCEELFDSDAVQKIAASSKGIPRVINMICDNALLTAYAMSEFRVRANMIDEVTDDLSIGDTRVTQEICRPTQNASLLPTPSEPGDDLVTTAKPESSDPVDMPALIGGLMTALRGDRHQQQLATGALLTALMLTVLGALVYSQKGIPVIVDLPTNHKASLVNSREEIKYAKLATAVFQETDPRTKIAPAVLLNAAGRNNTEQIPPRAADAVAPLADEKPVKAAPGAIQPIQTATNNLAAQKIVTGLVLEDDQRWGSNGSREDHNRANSPGTGDFDVVAASFVRGKPTFNADIIATLPPGSHINVSGRTGDYYQVRTLGNKTIHGYVHREDAFFSKPK
jgi:general secretion pathway protein A